MTRLSSHLTQLNALQTLPHSPDFHAVAWRYPLARQAVHQTWEIPGSVTAYHIFSHSLAAFPVKYSLSSHSHSLVGRLMCNSPLNLYHFLPYNFNVNWSNNKVSFPSNPNTVPLLMQITQAENHQNTTSIML